MSMSKIIMGVGLPGSGKTTALKQFADKNSYVYICPDDIRTELTGNASDQSKNREVWTEAHKRTANALEKGENVVFDATFARDSERKNFITFAREHGAEKIQGVVVDVDFETASERNKMRDRVVPEYAMKKMHSMLSEAPPEITDGFDSIFIIDEFQKLKHVEIGGEHKIVREFKIR